MTSFAEAARVDTDRVPSHVPPERVLPYDLLRISGPLDDPFKVLDLVRKNGPIFYTPVHFSDERGAWVLTRSQDIRAVLHDTDTFSSAGQSGFSRMLGDDWDMIPLEIDPPRHGAFRAILNPLFAPSRMAAMETMIRAVCVDLIEAMKTGDRAEFMQSFARPFPVRIFLQLMGFPLSLYQQFIDWNNTLLFASDMSQRIAAATSIRDYLRTVIAERKASPGAEGLLSTIVECQIDGISLSDDELLGTCYLLFVGGLDTVAASLGFYAKHLAEEPDHQRLLRDNRKMITPSVEELLRAHSVVMVSRRATRDTEIAGQAIKQGDWIALYTSLASLDPEDVRDPHTVDFSRKDNRHIGFSYGPHRCLGAHLARIELKVAIEELTSRMPDWRLDPDTPPTMHGGVVFSLDELWLRWG